jgi:hypothetical protein
MYREFWLENLMERENLEDLGIDGKVILKLVLNKQNGMVEL